MAVLGVVTIGQSPRTDLTGELAGYLPAHTEVIERGALDDWTPDAIAALAPQARDDTLVSRLRDGRSVLLDRRQLTPLLRDAIRAVEAAGADTTLIVCTGSFPQLDHRRPLLHADRLLVRGVSALVADGGPLGVVVPSPDQEDALGGRWLAALGAHVVVDHADPYAPDVMQAVPAAVARLSARGARISVLDCMGFTEAMRATAVGAGGAPVLLARSVVGRLTGELLGAQARTEEAIDGLASSARSV